MDNVSAIIVTRGDVDLDEIVASLPEELDELVIWNNGSRRCGRYRRGVPEGEFFEVSDLGVYGRYAAIEYARNEIILTQDDDCIVSDPQAIVDRFKKDYWGLVDDDAEDNFVVCNQPRDFRHSFYDDHSLVGFGAAFHRDAPALAFRRYWGNGGRAVTASVQRQRSYNGDIFRRTCDIVFTALTPRVLVDVPYENLPHAHAPNRMWKQPEHQSERSRMLELVRQVK